MKINKAKLLVGTLAVIATAATVGSISGTVAWFQYSTRSTVAYSGASAHCSENLQIRLHHAAVGTSGSAGYIAEYDSGWKSDLRLADVQAYMASGHWRNSTADYNLYPITSGNALKQEGDVASTFYKNPIYQYAGVYGATNTWKEATKADYVELPIELRVLDVNGANPDQFLAKDVYLSDLTIAQPATDATHGDITPAIRVSFDSANDVTFSKYGGTVATHGNLDLNADGRLDKVVGYEDFDDTLALFEYGGVDTDYTPSGAPTEVTTKIATATDENGMLANDADPYHIIGKKLGTTVADQTAAQLSVTVRIYLEGWQGLAKNGSVDNADGLESITTPNYNDSYLAKDTGKIWKWTKGDGESADAWVEDSGEKVWNDDKFVGASFNVGMRFSAEAHEDNAAHTSHA